MSTLWKEVTREVQTTLGRRRSSGAALHARVVHAPAGVQGLHVQEDEDGSGWDVVERRPQEDESMVHSEHITLTSSTGYLVGGEVGATEEEDEEYRRIWNLPEPPLRTERVADDAHAGSCMSGADDGGSSASPKARHPSLAPARETDDVHSDSLDARLAGSGGGNASFLGGSTPSPSSLRSSVDTDSASHGGLCLSAAESVNSLQPSTASICLAGPDSEASVSEGFRDFRAPSTDSAADHRASSTSAASECYSDAQSDPNGGQSTSAVDELTMDSARASSSDEGALEYCDQSAASHSASRGSDARPAKPLAGWRQLARVVWWMCTLSVSLLRWSLLLLHHATLGWMHAHNPKLTCIHVLRDVHCRKCVLQCIGINGLLFRGALYVYEHLLPQLCIALLGIQLQHNWLYELVVLLLWAAPAYLVCEIVSTSLQFKMAQKMTAAMPSPARASHTHAGGGGQAQVPVVDVGGGRQLPLRRRWAARMLGGMSQPSSADAEPTAVGAAADPADGDGTHPRAGAWAHAGVASCAGSRLPHEHSCGSPVVHVTEAADEMPSRDAILTFTSIVYTRLVYVAFVLQIKLLTSLPVLGPVLAILLSALLHAYDSFEFIWEHQGYGVAERFGMIEAHWLYFLGYGGVLATLSLYLRFWDLFAVRACLYPIYIANAPHAGFEGRACHPLPVFQLPLVVFNALLQLADLNLGE